VNDLRKEIDTRIETVVEAVRKNQRFNLLGRRINDSGERLLIEGATKDAARGERVLARIIPDRGTRRPGRRSESGGSTNAICACVRFQNDTSKAGLCCLRRPQRLCYLRLLVSGQVIMRTVDDRKCWQQNLLSVA